MIEQIIKDRDQLAQALRRNEHCFLQLLEHLPDGIVIQIKNKLVFVNATAARWFGLINQIEALPEKSLLDFLHPADRSALRQPSSSRTFSSTIPPSGLLPVLSRKKRRSRTSC